VGGFPTLDKLERWYYRFSTLVSEKSPFPLISLRLLLIIAGPLIVGELLYAMWIRLSTQIIFLVGLTVFGILSARWYEIHHAGEATDRWEVTPEQVKAALDRVVRDARRRNPERYEGVKD
jgi:hypothetical protein